MGRLQDPPADELAGGESDPEAEPGRLFGGGEPAPVVLLEFGAGLSPRREVAHHFGVGVELDLQLDVLVGERERFQSRCRQHWPAHRRGPSFTTARHSE
jgi:hypothetical protein